MEINQTRLAVRYADTDRMGIAHHSRYAIWFEEARTNLLKSHGFSYEEVEKQGVMLPLTDLACSFKRPARYDDVIIVYTRLIKIGFVRVIFAYEVYNSKDNILLATGQTDHAWTDINLKPVNIAKRIPQLYQLLNDMMKEIQTL